ECPDYRVHNGPGNFRRAVDLDARIAPIEELSGLDVVIMAGGTVDGQTKRINRVAANQIGRSERVRAGEAAPVTGVLKQVRVVVPRIRYDGTCQKNSPKQGMFWALLIVDLADIASIVLCVPVAVCNFTARIFRRRKRLRASIIDDE